MKIEDCYARYGNLGAAPEGGMFWKNAPDWIVPVMVPNEVVLRNYLGKPVYRIFCNKDMAGPLNDAFQRLINVGAHLELETFDGCFSVRWIRGIPGVPSFHSWGIAIDFNAKKNPLGGASSWSPLFIACMESAGFTYGGRFSRSDPMHFQLAQIPKTL
jgi:hypothetical protein